MYDLERQEKILQILKEKNSISVNKLSELLFASPSTIRRDLSHMEQKGLVERTFGGVVLASRPSNKETSFELRENTNLSVKRSLCQKASQLIKDNSTIFLDSSSTLLPLVPYLNSFSNLTIITNGLFVATEIINKTKHRVIIPGGEIQPNTNSMLGPITISNIKSFHADMTIMSASALEPLEGISESTVEQGNVKRSMIENSDSVICLIDSTKVHKASLFKTCPIQDIDVLISDGDFTQEEKQALAAKDVKLIQ